MILTLSVSPNALQLHGFKKKCIFDNLPPKDHEKFV